MKTIIGPAAEGEHYFDRPYLDKKFWKKVAESHNVSIAAPRRVGKSSFMLNLVEKPIKGYQCVYIITESVNEANEFFKKIYKVLYSQLNTEERFKQFFEDVVSRLNIRKISVTEIEFNKPDINYFDEILLLCKEVKQFPKILLLVDEFSQTVDNIITDRSKESAKNFLHQCRELRQDPNVKSKISFIYTGSIGLENLVLSIGEPRSISDLGNFSIPPLSEKEGEELIKQIIDGEVYTFSKADRQYFFSRLKWLLPYFIQVMMSEIEGICDDNQTSVITVAIIDDAFQNSLHNRSYFEHWLVRLRSVFKGRDFSCAKEILNISASKEGIDYYELKDLVNKYHIEDTAIIINVLLHDGYLVKDETLNKYRFISPLLQEWWKSNIVI